MAQLEAENDALEGEIAGLTGRLAKLSAFLILISETLEEAARKPDAIGYLKKVLPMLRARAR